MLNFSEPPTQREIIMRIIIAQQEIGTAASAAFTAVRLIKGTVIKILIQLSPKASTCQNSCLFRSFLFLYIYIYMYIY